MVDNADQKLYEQALKLTAKYSDALKKHFLLAIGGMLYIAFIVMATIFYKPSFFACIGSGGMMWGLLNAVVNALFVALYVLFLFQGLLPSDVLSDLRVALPSILFVCMLYLLVSYGALFFRCRDAHNCNSAECTYNRAVMLEVNKSKTLRELHAFYKKQMGVTRPSVSSCANYYNASHESGAKGKPCTPSSKSTLCNISTDPAIGAPVLSEFFVMTSGRTGVVGPQCDGYMSTQMIVIALTAGARCLDFDVSALNYGNDTTPIVTVARDRDNRNLQRNFIFLEDCFKTIMRYWFGASSVVGNVGKKDPLFIHLNFRRSLTTKCMDNIAKLINYYFNQYMGEYLLGDDFHHGEINMGEIPLCMVFSRVVIMVNSPYRAPSTLLDPLINSYCGVGSSTGSYKNEDWSTVKNSTNARQDYVKYNKKKLTFVETSFHPYQPISSTPKNGEGGVSSDMKATYTTRDSMSDLVLNKQTINNNPMVPFQYGCQFVAMNFQNLDDDMRLYMGFFKNSSFLLKPKSLRRDPLKFVTTAQYGKCGTASVTMSNTKNAGKCQQICLSEADAQTFEASNQNVYWSRSECDASLYTENFQPSSLDFGGNSLTVNNFQKPASSSIQ